MSFVYFILRLALQRWTDHDDIYCSSYDVLPRKEVPFGGRYKTAPHLGGEIPLNPIFGDKRFQAKVATY